MWPVPGRAVAGPDAGGGQRASRAIAWSCACCGRRHSHGDILLLTDHADGDARAAAARRLRGIPRLRAGLGTAAGRAYRRSDGAIAQARLDAASLRALAAAGGGRYMPTGTRTPRELASWTAHALVTRRCDRQHRPHVARRGLLAAAAVDAAGAAGVPSRRGAGRCCLPALCLPWAPAHATEAAPGGDGLWRQRPGGACALARGIQAYRRGDFAAAERAWRGLDGPEAAYNRGNALARTGRYEDAIAAYDQALRVEAGHGRCAGQPAAVLAAMQRQPPPGPAPGPRAGRRRQGQPKAAARATPGGRARRSPAAMPRQASAVAPSQPNSPATPTRHRSRAADSQAQGAPMRQAQAMRACSRRLSAGRTAGARRRDQSGAGPCRRAETAAEREQRLANEAWLQRIPDDPGGLLRARFRLEHERRLQQGDRDCDSMFGPRPARRWCGAVLLAVLAWWPASPLHWRRRRRAPGWTATASHRRDRDAQHRDRPGHGGEPGLRPLAADFIAQRPQQQPQLRAPQRPQQRARAVRAWRCARVATASCRSRRCASAIGHDAPLALTVTPPRRRPPARAGTAFIEAEADDRQPYVQQAVGYVVRLYYAAPLVSGQLDQPGAGRRGAAARRQRPAVQRERGAVYTVVERRFLLIPERSGTLVMPAAHVRGPGGGRLLRRDVRRWPAPELSRHRHAGGAAVRPMPDAAPQPWLPLHGLSLRYLAAPADGARRRGGDGDGRGDRRWRHGRPAAGAGPVRRTRRAGVRRTGAGRRTLRHGRPQVRVTRSFSIVPGQGGPLRIAGPRLDWWDVRASGDAALVVAAPRSAVALRRALEGGDLGTIADALHALAPTPAKGAGLEDIARQLDDDAQRDAVTALQQARWGAGDPAAARGALRRAFARGPRWRKPSPAAQAEPLPPLYPR
jgi:Ca-activated chloride channel homolog